MTTFEYVAVLVSIVVGLGVAHLLHGLGRLVGQPGRWKPYWLHILWAVNTFLYIIHFWWWEFQLNTIAVWNSWLYLFLVFFTVLLFLLCVVLFPDDFPDGKNYREYYYARRAWFFGLWIAVMCMDSIDTLLRGAGYLETLPGRYWWVQGAIVLLFAAAIRWRSPRLHAAFAVVFAWIQLGTITSLNRTIS